MKDSRKALMQQRSKSGLVTGAIAASWFILQSMLVATPALAQKEQTLEYGELLKRIDAGQVTKIELDPAQQTAKVQ